MIPQDPIVAEVHAARQALFAEAGGDAKVFFGQLRQREEKARRDGLAFLDPPPARPAADRGAA